MPLTTQSNLSYDRNAGADPQRTNPDENIVVYVKDFEADVDIISPDFGDVTDISGYNAEATIFVNADGFRSQFLVSQHEENEEMRYTVEEQPTKMNLTDPTNSAASSFVDLNPAKANVVKYTDMCGNYDPKFNGNGTLGLQEDILNNATTNDKLATNSQYFKVCHDYVRHMADSLGVSPADSRTFNNRNALVSDILSKGQISVVNDLLVKMRHPSEDSAGNPLIKHGKDVKGYDVANQIYKQIQEMNPGRLELQRDASGDFIGLSDAAYTKSQMYEAGDQWQEIPLIAGDVVCFKFTFNEIQGVKRIDNVVDVIPARTYLIKLCLVDAEDAWARNLPTKVIDFDPSQLKDDDTPDDDDEVLTFYQNVIGDSNASALKTVSENTSSSVLQHLTTGGEIIAHYRAKQNIGGASTTQAAPTPVSMSSDSTSGNDASDEVTVGGSSSGGSTSTSSNPPFTFNQTVLNAGATKTLTLQDDMSQPSNLESFGFTQFSDVENAITNGTIFQATLVESPTKSGPGTVKILSYAPPVGGSPDLKLEITSNHTAQLYVSSFIIS